MYVCLYSFIQFTDDFLAVKILPLWMCGKYVSRTLIEYKRDLHNLMKMSDTCVQKIMVSIVLLRCNISELKVIQEEDDSASSFLSKLLKNSPSDEESQMESR